MRTTPVARFGWSLARYGWRRFALGTLLWVAWASGPAVFGLGLQAIFEAMSGDAPGGLGVPAIAVGLAGVEGVRLVFFFCSIVLLTHWWVRGTALVRTNLLHAQLASGGPHAGPPVARAGAAIPVFRDDVTDMMELVDTWIDLAGVVLFSVVALVVMVRIDPALTLVVVVPLALVVLANAALTERLRQARRADREATARVTGLLGNLCAAVLAVKVAGADGPVVARLGRLTASAAGPRFATSSSPSRSTRSTARPSTSRSGSSSCWSQERCAPASSPSATWRCSRATSGRSRGCHAGPASCLPATGTRR
jgi:ABC-type multidrug transport system fused ATPase/permease subunit